MSNCYIIIHQGIGDLFNSIGLINYYTSIYDKVHIFLLDELRKNIYNEVFLNNDKIDCIIPDFTNELYEPTTCIICMTNYNTLNCPRINSEKCKYINYKKYDGDIIKIGSFNNFDEWTNYRFSQSSFAHAFYTYNRLDPNIRFDNFKLFNNKDKENIIYEDFIKKYGNNYILIHEDINRNYYIDKNKIINKNLPIINLDNISNYFVDYCKVIKNAQEIHLIDSSWSVLIYLLSYKEINTKVFLFESFFINLDRDINIYKNPTFNNWNFY
jgi:hypothetical protein